MSTQELDKSQFTALILVTGVDAPGVTQALFDELSPFSITVLDIEQVVNRNRLILTALIALDPAHADAIESDLLLLGKRLDLDIAIDFSDVILETVPSAQHLHVVMMAGALKPSAVSAVSGAIAAAGGNIERIRRTAAYPLYAIEFDVTISAPTNDADSVVNLRQSLAQVSRANGVDLAVELGGLIRRAKRIVLLDMDSTLIQQEVIDLLAEKAGVGDQVKAITESAMKGELDFKESLTARVALLSGLKSTVLQEVARELVLSAGARTLIRTLHKLGHKVGVVSGGFINVIEPLLKELEIDFYSANELEIVDGALTGKVVGGIVDRAAKAEALRSFAAAEGVTLSQTIAIGDGANDLDMIELAGLGIAFNAKPAVRMAADSALTSPYLDSVLYLMGITREEVESATD